jgi:hypothetical protein
VRLIEVAGVVNGVEDTDALLQQAGGVACAFDLSVMRMRHASGLNEMTLRRPA